MLANLTTPLLGIVGTGAIGQLGSAHLLGGVAMSAVIFDFLFWLFGFLRMGTVAMTAQALGAGDKQEQRAVLARALVLSTAIGVALIALQVPLAAVIFRLMGGSAAVTESASVYFHVRIWSAPLALGNYVILGWLIGLARMREALALQIAINVLNMAATAAFVLVFGMGVTGAALAAIAGEGFGLAAGLWITRDALHPLGRFTGRDVFDRATLLRMFAINRDIMIRTAALIAAFGFFTAQGARTGDVTLAANAVLYNVVIASAYFLDGFATAAQQLCGYAVGAGDRSGFRRTVRLIIGWGFVFGIGTTLASLFGGGAFIDMMTSSPEVRAAAREMLFYTSLAGLAGVLAFGFDGVFIGATWTRDMRNLMLAALTVYFAAWVLLQSLGNAGLWIALLVFLIARGLLQSARYPHLLEKTFPVSPGAGSGEVPGARRGP